MELNRSQWDILLTIGNKTFMKKILDDYIIEKNIEPIARSERLP